MTPRSLTQNLGRVYSMPQGTDLMTPRSLAQNPGGVYSMPQGMELKFLVKGAHLPTWMASASYEVEHKGSTMYNTPSILAQLGECDVRISTSCQERVTSQSNLLTLLIWKRVTCFLLSGNTLAYLGFNQGGILSTIPAIRNQLMPTQGRQNCDVYYAGMTMCHHGSDTFWRCRPSTDGTVLMGTNWKEDSPVKTAHRVIEVMLTGCNGVFRGIDALRTLIIIKIQSNTLEGSETGTCQHVNPSMHEYP